MVGRNYNLMVSDRAKSEICALPLACNRLSLGYFGPRRTTASVILLHRTHAALCYTQEQHSICAYTYHVSVRTLNFVYEKTEVV